MVVAAGIILLLIGADRALCRGRVRGGRRFAAAACAACARTATPPPPGCCPIVEDPQRLNRYIAASQVGITLSRHGARRICRGGDHAARRAAPRPLVSPYAPTTAESLAQRLGPHFADDAVGDRRRDGAENRRAPLSDRNGAGDDAADAVVGAGLRVVHRHSRSQRHAAAPLLRVPTATHRHVHSPEEIGLLIAESRDGGLLEPQEQVRLHRALRLGLRDARQLMVPRDRLAAIEITTPLARRPAHRRDEPLQPAAGLPGDRSTTSSASCTRRTW